MSSKGKNKKKSPDDVEIEEILSAIRSVMMKADRPNEDKSASRSKTSASKKAAVAVRQADKPTAYKKDSTPKEDTASKKQANEAPQSKEAGVAVTKKRPDQNARKKTTKKAAKKSVKKAAKKVQEKTTEQVSKKATKKIKTEKNKDASPADQKEDDILVLTDIVFDDLAPLVLTEVASEKEISIRKELTKSDSENDDRFHIFEPLKEGEAPHPEAVKAQEPEKGSIEQEGQAAFFEEEKFDVVLENVIRQKVEDYVAEYLNQNMERIVKKIAEEGNSKTPNKS